MSKGRKARMKLDRARFAFLAERAGNTERMAIEQEARSLVNDSWTRSRANAERSKA